jgi:hypothetical protein
MSVRSLKWLLLGLFFAVSLHGQGFGAEWREPPAGQPTQMQSQVNYDPKLSDPFFTSYERSYPDCDGKQRTGLHTAKCFSSFNESEINCCDAKLVVDGALQLYLHVHGAHYLRIALQKGKFRSQYWYYYKARTPGDEFLTWTTTEQELTLNRKVYRKGDVIKGRIYFVCVQGNSDPKLAEKFAKNPRIIKIEGVFKTVVK